MKHIRRYLRYRSYGYSRREALRSTLRALRYA